MLKLMKQPSGPPIATTFLKCSHCHKSGHIPFHPSSRSGSCCPVMIGCPESTFIFLDFSFSREVVEFLKEQLFLSKQNLESYELLKFFDLVAYYKCPNDEIWNSIYSGIYWEPGYLDSRASFYFCWNIESNSYLYSLYVG